MIAPETIALVRDRTDIVSVISESVPSLKRRGRSFVGLCPFHKEKSPSFHVNPDRGFFHCFGCKESGSVIDFVMKDGGYTFPEAVRVLAERAGIEIEEDRRDRTDADRARKAKEDLYSASQLAAVFFEEQLRSHPLRSIALEELARRGIVPGASPAIDDALQAFRIGYAPAEWDGLTQYFRKHGISPVVGESIGALVPRSSGSGHYDRFRHRLMFAVVDPQGRVVAFSGRALPDPPGVEPREDKPAKYINSPESPIYSKGHCLFGLWQARHAIRQEQSAIVVEGNFDVFSLHARGLQNVVAPLGTAFTVDQAKLLRRYAPSVTLLFDGDAAGRKAIRASREPCIEAGLTVKVASLPDGSDPDDLARARGVEAVKQLLASGKGMLEFLIDDLFDRLRSTDPHEQLACVDELTRLLSSEDDPLIRMQLKAYVDRAAGRLLDIRTRDTAIGTVDRGSFRALEAKVRAKVREGVREGARRAGAPHASASAVSAGSGARGAATGSTVSGMSGLRSGRERYADGESREMGVGAGVGAGAGAAAGAPTGAGGARDAREAAERRERRGRDREAAVDAQDRRDFSPRASEGADPRTARVSPKTPGSTERREIVGCLIEHPSLLNDPEVTGELGLLEGPAVLVVAALRASLQDREKADGSREIGLDTSRFLAQIPPAIQAFASERLAAPRHDELRDAKSHLLENADKLRKLVLSRETEEIARDVERAAGDAEEENNLMREALERARQKHKIGR